MKGLLGSDYQFGLDILIEGVIIALEVVACSPMQMLCIECGENVIFMNHGDYIMEIAKRGIFKRDAHQLFKGRISPTSAKYLDLKLGRRTVNSINNITMPQL